MHTQTRDAVQAGKGRMARIRAWRSLALLSSGATCAGPVAHHTGTCFGELCQEVGGQILSAGRVYLDAPLVRYPAEEMYVAMAGRGDSPVTVAVDCTHGTNQTAHADAAARSPTVGVGPEARVVPVEIDAHGQVLVLMQEVDPVVTRERHAHSANGW